MSEGFSFFNGEHDERWDEFEYFKMHCDAAASKETKMNEKKCAGTDADL